MNQATHNLLSNLSTAQLEQLCTDSGYLDMEFYTAEPVRFMDNSHSRTYTYTTTCDDHVDGGTLRGNVYVVFNHTNGDIHVDLVRVTAMSL